MSNETNNTPKFSRDISGKFLFMRHGQTFYNQTSDLSRRINPELSDSHLTEEGEKQAKLNQNIIKFGESICFSILPCSSDSVFSN